MAKQKLNYRFHDPNPPGVAAEAIIRVLVEANMPKLERAIQNAAEESDPTMHKKVSRENHSR